MGYGTRDGSIRTFWPDDDENTMYIDSSPMVAPICMADLLQKIYEKWEGASLTNITIQAEKIHTDCLGYDLYDPGDYTEFIVIRRLPGA